MTAPRVTPRGAVLFAEGCAVVAAAPAAGWGLCGLGLVLLLVGSHPLARRMALRPGVRLALQCAMVVLTMVGLIQLQDAGPGLVVDDLLPLILALLVCRAPMAQTRRDLAVDLVLCVMLLVVCAAVTSTFDGGLPLLLAWPALVLAAIALQYDTLATGATAVATRNGSARRSAGWFVASSTAFACLIGLSAWLLLPSGQSDQLRHKLGVQTTSAFGPNSSTSASGPSGARGVAAYTGGQLDLSLRGALPQDPLLRVPADSPQLWRAQVFSVYDGRFWGTRRQEPALVAGGPVHTLPASDEVFATTGVAREDVVTPLVTSRDLPVWSPGLPTVVTTRGQVVIDSSGVIHVLGVRQAPSYAVRSIVPTATGAGLRAATGADPSDSIWTSLPSIPARVPQLARSIASDSEDRYTQMRRVESWLRTNILYDLNAPVPRSGQDSVDAMLFETHRGFCEHFASAETVLLRALGVPARVATGLAGGDPGPRADTREFRGEDSHAWVEVYFPGIGWVASDPTAGAELAPSSDSGNVVAAVVTAVKDVLRSLTQVPGGRRTLGFALAGLVVLALLLYRRPQRSVTIVAGARTGRQGPVLLAFLTFEHRRRAIRAREPAESAREYVDSTGNLTALGDAVGVLEEECYGRQQPPPALAVAAAEAFASAAVPASVSQTLSSE